MALIAFDMRRTLARAFVSPGKYLDEWQTIRIATLARGLSNWDFCRFSDARRRDEI